MLKLIPMTDGLLDRIRWQVSAAHEATRTALAAQLEAALADVTPLIGPVSEMLAHFTSTISCLLLNTLLHE